MKFSKILIALLLAFMILTLSSCSAFLGRLAHHPTEPPTEPPTEFSGPTDSSEGPPSGTPAGFTVFPEGEYLEERFRTSDPIPGFDYVPTFHGSSANGTPTSCSTETTYYYMAKSADGWGTMLYYMDKATGISGPLCGKPECDHTNNTCNGYIGDRSCHTLSLYDGRIWWVNLGVTTTLRSCALDGTDHREEFQISRDLVGTGGVPDIYFHRGTMYWVETSTNIVGGIENTHNEIIAFPLDGGEPYFIYRADPAIGWGFPCVYFLRDKLLLIFDRTVIDYAEDDVTITDWHPAIDIYLFDLNTRQLKTLFSGDTDFFLGGSWPILREDGMYIAHGDIVEDGRCVPTSRFLPWGGETFEPMEYQSRYGWAYLDGKLISLSLGASELTVKEWALDGTVILDRSFPVRYTGNPILKYCVGWDEDFYYILLPSVRVAVATDGHAIYYLAGTEEEQN